MGNLKSVFADFEIFQGKSCACDAVERVSQLKDIGSGRVGSDYVAAKKMLIGRFYLNVERWNQCSEVSSVGNRAKKDDKLSAQLDESTLGNTPNLNIGFLHQRKPLQDVM